MTNLERFTTQEYADQFKTAPGRKYYGKYGTGYVVLRNGAVAVHLKTKAEVVAWVNACVATFRADRAKYFPGLPL